jgi:hypothetical protein
MTGWFISPMRPERMALWQMFHRMKTEPSPLKKSS